MKIEVGLGSRSYWITVEVGAWEILPAHLKAASPSGIAVVTDDRVQDLYARDLIKILETAGFNPLVYSVPAGEGSKSFEQISGLCRFMADNSLDRDCLVLALGGGVVGDLAGFAASIYLRGVRYIQLPTTLLSMVDSSVGGKTGINIPQGKNLVGTFYQPEAVFANTAALATLDERDWYSGVAEAVKMALTLDKDLFEELSNLDDLSPAGGMDVASLVASCCLIKARVVEQDERESGLRKVLNFGHTLAHALETALGYGTLRHGEAVVLGMKAALDLSRQYAGLSDDECRKAMSLLARIPVPPVDLTGDLVTPMSRDKKARDGTVEIVLVRDIGRYMFHPLADLSQLAAALPSLGR